MKEKSYGIINRAINSEGESITIREAVNNPSYKGEYFCPECHAKFGIKDGNLRAAHFYHLPSNVTGEEHCSYADESYRHKLAKEILQRLGQIKVPKVVVQFPESTGGGQFTISGSRIVKSTDIKIERYVSEMDTGELLFSRAEMGNTLTLIKPDAILFENSKPILFIEFCVTHKTDRAKVEKLQSIGINTIEVRIPANFTATEIESIFSSTDYTKWLYHDEKFNFDLSDLRRDSKATGEGSEDDGKFNEKSFVSCCLFQIEEQIRRINRFMRTDEFVSRSNEFEEAERRLRDEFQQKEEDHRRESEDLERRYTLKRDKIERVLSKLQERNFRKTWPFTDRIKLLGDQIAKHEGGQFELYNVRESIRATDLEIERIRGLERTAQADIEGEMESLLRHESSINQIDEEERKFLEDIEREEETLKEKDRRLRHINGILSDIKTNHIRSWSDTR